MICLKEKKYQLKSKEDNLDNHTEVTFVKDGAIYFSDKRDHAESFIYLYPKQAKKLIKIIEKRLSHEERGTKQ